MNKGLLMRQQTKPLRESPEDLEEDVLLYEVMFDKEASIAECFKSALKCWRIFQPNVILIEE